MYFIAVFVLLGTRLTVNSEIHSLTYIYTAFSKPVGLPGIYEFTAMGLLDGRMIDYYDNDLNKTVPKQPWMKEQLDADYREKVTQSRPSKQQWFKVNIDILKKRMNQTDDDVHILQWMHGCEGEKRRGGGVMFNRSVFMFNYDGHDPTKTKWDGFQDLKENTIDYLESECIDWLNKFLPYEEKQLQEASPPDVYVFATNAKTETNVMLTCLATGFYPKDIRLEIKRDGRVLTKEDGLLTSGVRPNEDDTYQRRDSVEILRSDVASYRCEVTHRATNVYVEKIWDHKHPGGNSGGINAVMVVVVLLLVVIVAVLLVLLYRNGIIGGGGPINHQAVPLLEGPAAQGGGGHNNYQAVPRDEGPAAQGNAPSATTNNVQGSDSIFYSGDSGVSSAALPAPTINVQGPDGSPIIDDSDATRCNGSCSDCASACESVRSLNRRGSGVSRSVRSLISGASDVSKSVRSLISGASDVSKSVRSLISGAYGVSSVNEPLLKDEKKEKDVQLDEVPDTGAALPATTINVQGGGGRCNHLAVPLLEGPAAQGLRSHPSSRSSSPGASYNSSKQRLRLLRSVSA